MFYRHFDGYTPVSPRIIFHDARGGAGPRPKKMPRDITYTYVPLQARREEDGLLVAGYGRWDRWECWHRHPDW